MIVDAGSGGDIACHRVRGTGGRGSGAQAGQGEQDGQRYEPTFPPCAAADGSTGGAMAFVPCPLTGAFVRTTGAIKVVTI
jgi:hypothetical protein